MLNNKRTNTQDRTKHNESHQPNKNNHSTTTYVREKSSLPLQTKILCSELHCIASQVFASAQYILTKGFYSFTCGALLLP